MHALLLLLLRSPTMTALPPIVRAFHIAIAEAPLPANAQFPKFQFLGLNSVRTQPQLEILADQFDNLFHALHAIHNASWDSNANRPGILAAGTNFNELHQAHLATYQPSFYCAVDAQHVINQGDHRLINLKTLIALAHPHAGDNPATAQRVLITWLQTRVMADPQAPPPVYGALVNTVEFFTGTMGSEYTPTDFIAAIEGCAVPGADTPADKLRLAKMKLRGPARQLLRAGQGFNIMDWEQFKDALKARFEPVLDPVQTSIAFRSASQRPGKSVQCYLARLRDLASKWEQTQPPIDDGDHAKRNAREQLMNSEMLVQFLRGLDKKYKKYVTLQCPAALPTAVKYAQAEEAETLAETTQALHIAALLSSEATAECYA